jgi:hypothetical protein
MSGCPSYRRVLETRYHSRTIAEPPDLPHSFIHAGNPKDFPSAGSPPALGRVAHLLHHPQTWESHCHSADSCQPALASRLLSASRQRWKPTAFWSGYRTSCLFIDGEQLKTAQSDDSNLQDRLAVLIDRYPCYIQDGGARQEVWASRSVYEGSEGATREQAGG